MFSTIVDLMLVGALVYLGFQFFVLRRYLMWTDKQKVVNWISKLEKDLDERTKEKITKEKSDFSNGVQV